MSDQTDTSNDVSGRGGGSLSEHFNMSFGDHLEDLRRRLILGLVGVVPIFIGALALGQPILALLIEPLRDELREASQPSSLLATNPLETFATYIHISLIATVLVGSPWLLYQLWMFIAPGLYKHERRFVATLVPLSTGLTVCSAAFLYFVVLPVILAFFIGFGTQLGQSSTPVVGVPEGVELPVIPVLEWDPEDPPVGSAWINTNLMQLRVVAPLREAGRTAIVGAELVSGAGITQQYRVSEYVRTLLNLALAFGVGFQTPVVVLLLGWAGLVDRLTFARGRRYAVGACVVAGAVLTPSDPLSMLLLAAPLYLLFELGLVLLRVMPPGYEKRRQEAEEALRVDEELRAAETEAGEGGGEGPDAGADQDGR